MRRPDRFGVSPGVSMSAPRRLTTRWSSPPLLAPRIRQVPVVGLTSPSMHRMAVVLPAPFLAEQAEDPAFGHTEVEAVQCNAASVTAPICLGDPDHLDDGVVR